MNILDASQSVGLVAAEYPCVIPVLEKFGIDYYCRGNLSLREAAQTAGRELDELIELLRARVGLRHRSWLDRAMVELVDHLKENHHRFLNGLLQYAASELADLVAAVSCAELITLRDRFRSLVDTLIPHFEEEERDLFPLVDALETAWERNQPSPFRDQPTLRHSMTRILQQHGAIAAELSRFRKAGVAAAAARPGARMAALLHTIDQIARNLHDYMHLENNVLFPRAVAMEAELTLEEPSVAAVSRDQGASCEASPAISR